jgi:hypothetical protein
MKKDFRGQSADCNRCELYLWMSLHHMPGSTGPMMGHQCYNTQQDMASDSAEDVLEMGRLISS